MPLYTIAPHDCFLPSLYKGLLERYPTSSWHQLTLVLPTQRAAESWHRLLMQEIKMPLLWPKIVTLGDSQGLLDCVQHIAMPLLKPLTKQKYLWHMTEHIAQQTRWDAEHALTAAGAILQLLTVSALEDISLATVIKAGLEAYQGTSQELWWNLATSWVEKSQVEGWIDPVSWRAWLISAWQQEIAEHGLRNPVVAAGSTASHRVTGKLLAKIACAPEGAVILPGYIHNAAKISQPHSGMDRWKQRFANEMEVQPWTEPTALPDQGRAALVQVAFTEAIEATTLVFKGIEFAECKSEEAEARLIAMRIRKAQAENHSILVVTNHRYLRQRLADLLSCWHIAPEMSTDQGQQRTQAAIVASLILDVTNEQEPFAAVPLLALLSHPWVVIGTVLQHQRCRQRLEHEVLRGLRLLPGHAAIGEAIDRLQDEAMSQWWRQLTAVLEVPPHRTLSAWGTWHQKIAEMLTQQRPEISELFSPLQIASTHIACESGTIYQSLLQRLLQSLPSTRKSQPTPGVSIFSAQEARLLSADIIVLAGLVEGNWPETSPALSLAPSFIAGIGLPAAEEAIAQAAHDLYSWLWAKQLLLTRAIKQGQRPALASRWWWRMEAWLTASGQWQSLLVPGEQHQLAEMLFAGSVPETLVYQPPAPCPPLSARLHQFSVTGVELLMRDPYGFYAKNILQLKPLDVLAESPSYKHFGIVVHSILEKLVHQAKPLTLECWRKAMSYTLKRYGLQVFPMAVLWEQRLLRLGEAWCKHPLAVTPLSVYAEISGSMALMATKKLQGKADRLHYDAATHRCLIIDFKTGTTPSEAEIRCGLAPQLPLLGLIAMNGGFAGMTPSAVTFAYVRMTGRDPPLELTLFSEATSEQWITTAKEGLNALMQIFLDPRTPYFCCPHGVEQLPYSPYAHLARWQEWKI
jgi:ATP-dependent helicase/nuclease subunit B